MRILIAGIAVAAAAGGITGCTGSSQSPRACCGLAHAPAPRGAVRVVGVFEAVGGPAGAAPSPLSGQVRFLPLASRGPDGARLKPISVPVGPDGRFRTLLPASSYDVVGRSPQFDGGHVGCGLDPHRPRPLFGTAVHHVALYCQRK